MNFDFPQTARHWIPVLTGLVMIAIVGCQADQRKHSVGVDDFANHGTLAPNHFLAMDHEAFHRLPQQARHRVAKPAIQSASHSATNSGQGGAARYPVVQATYQYPATNPPGQPPLQIGAPQNGFQLNAPVQLPNGQFQQRQFQSQTPQAPNRGQFGQFQQPALQYGQVPNLGQPSFNQPALVQPGGYGQTIQPGFYPNQSPSGLNFGQSFPPVQQPELLDVDVFIPQNPSGRFSIGGTYSSDNNVLGQIILEEHDFDFRAWPRNLRDAFGPYAWRGGGQRFRVEAVPGADLERYLVSWSDPYFRGTDSSLSLSAYLFERQYFDWDEKRVGGRISVGRRLSQYLTLTAGLRLEDVTLDNPRVAGSSQLNANLGDNDLYLASIGFAYDTRVLPYLTGLGTYFGATFTQAFGDFSYSRGELEFRNHQKVFARPDDSGRHIIGFRSLLGFTGSSTPVFENFYSGGLSTLRGFDFRGVSPIDGGARVGGEFQWINSLEYTFPLTADDMIRGAMFVDFGTVEQEIEINSENFRVAPGLGLRVHLPFAGLGAPLSFDFAFPIATGTGDDEKSFSFFIGAVR